MPKTPLALVGLTLSLSVNAALVDHGTYATDTATNIDYLYLSQTVGRSYYSLVEQDYLGYIADGWELTSQTALFNMSLEDRILINDEATSQWSVSPGVYTIINNEDMQGGQFSTGPGWVDTDWWDNGTAFSLGNSIEDVRDSDYWGAAVSLQRASVVPVPAAAWLFGSALIGLIGFKRNK